MPDDKKEYMHFGPAVDLFEHKMSYDCWCRPERDELALHVLIHYSMLEEYNIGQRKLN